MLIYNTVVITQSQDPRPMILRSPCFISGMLGDPHSKLPPHCDSAPQFGGEKGARLA